MMGHVHLILALLLLTIVPSSQGQLFSNEDNPSLLDRVLQVVWEPSSLIRMWVGLDQLYNIVLSWRSVAKKLASLPFGEGRSMDHVKIQEPRSFKYRKPSVASQWDRFNQIYSSSSLSPIVADARSRLVYAQHPNKFPLIGNGLQAAEHRAHPKVYQPELDPALGFGLPPSFFLRIEDSFLDAADSADLLKSANGVKHSLPFDDDSTDVARLLDIQRQENQRIVQNERFPNQFVGVGVSSAPQMVNDASGVLGGPQERLNIFLKLLKALGDEHGNEIRRESLDTSDR